jgi:Protein of unknown function (DUF3892)
VPIAAYRIVCVERQTVGQPESHVHIVRIGTADDGLGARQWSIQQVLAAMEEGDVFYTQDMTSGKIASVSACHCAQCRQTYIRSDANAAAGNNLDNLPNSASP